MIMNFFVEGISTLKGFKKKNEDKVKRNPMHERCLFGYFCFFYCEAKGETQSLGIGHCCIYIVIF